MRRRCRAAVLAGMIAANLGAAPSAYALRVPAEPPPPRVPGAASGASPTIESIAPTWLPRKEPGRTAGSKPGASSSRSAASARVETRADFGKHKPSNDTRRIADWVLRSHDNRRMPFVIVDKKLARLYLFNEGGKLVDATPILLGLARGDHSVPGIGERKMADIRPHERTTPAGRFVAELGRNLKGEQIVWVSYDDAVSIHRLRRSPDDERRPQRLATATPADNRISYGCINVPPPFFDKLMKTAFSRGNAIVYVLPEQQAPHRFFGA
jgi:hypothetical protein